MAADSTDATAARAGESFPRQRARTLNFSCGAPRSFTVTVDESTVLFLRSRHGSDRVGRLWSLDLGSGEERLVADPDALLAEADEELSAAERARRERARESAAGIVAYAVDDAARLATFALSSRLWLAKLAPGGATRELDAVGPVLDPRLDPTGTWVAYVGAGALRVIRSDGSDARVLAEPDGPDVTWGLAEFVAAEEMDRLRGYWWAPDGASLLAARVDESPVLRWYIADPANPDREPAKVAYPAAGSDNADVSLHLLTLTGDRREVVWNRREFPYLVAVQWSASGAPLARVMTRDQKTSQVLEIDVGSGTTTVLHQDKDDRWLDAVVGVPARLTDGRLLHTADAGQARRLMVGEEVVTPESLQVSHVVAVDEAGVLFAGTEEPTELHLWRWSPSDGLSRLTGHGGYHSGTGSGQTHVLLSRDLDRPGARARVVRSGADVAEIASYAETPVITAHPHLMTVGERDLRVGVLMPRDHRPGTPLPVLLDPYGGPHHQEVVEVYNMWLEPQWLADQGFAVIVADGRGTGSRGPEWDRAIYQNVGAVTLEDQVDALQAVAEEVPDLDLGRVAMRGWSYGGYLAARAVLERPDVFHAAVSGAPVTDWALYDTFYTERYLGHPEESPEAYERTSLLPLAPRLERPLLLIQGLADDNVVAANTLRLSSALLAAGRPHDVLPLSGVTHMTPQEEVAENLLLLQVEWLRRALAR